MPASIRLIAIDIDGTLLPSAGTAISQRTCQAMRAAEDAGIHVVIATGRRHAYALPILEQVGLRPETILVSSNGAVVRNLSGALIERTLLPAQTARQLCQALRPYGDTMIFTFDRDDARALVLENLRAVQGQIARWVEANLAHIKEVAPLERAFDDEAPLQGMMCGPVARVREAEAALAGAPLSRQLAMHRTEYPDRDLGILDLLPPGCSKASALVRVAAALGVRRSEVMAIGDNLNDLEMLEYAGHPVLMSNAGEEMRALAARRGWRLAPGNDEDGVACVLEELLGETIPLVTKDHSPGSPSAAPAW